MTEFLIIWRGTRYMLRDAEWLEAFVNKPGWKANYSVSINHWGVHPLDAYQAGVAYK